MTRSSKRHSRNKLPARPFAAFETLENRQLFSVTAGLVGAATDARAPVPSGYEVDASYSAFVNNGTLFVNGSNAADVLNVRYNQGTVLSPYFGSLSATGTTADADTASLGPAYEVQRNGV